MEGSIGIMMINVSQTLEAIMKGTKLLRTWGFVLTVLIAAATSVPETGYAFDGQRKGFILGVGVGGGNIPFVRTNYGELSNSGYDIPYVDNTNARKWLFRTDFKMGYAPDNYWQIYWMSKVFWFQSEMRYWDSGYYGRWSSYEGTDLAICGLAGIGITYSFRPETPSPFIMAGIGYSTLGKVAPIEYYDEEYDSYYGTVNRPEVGTGYVVGFGYEFTRHLSIEADLAYLSPSKTAGWNGTSISLVLNVLGY